MPDLAAMPTPLPPSSSSSAERQYHLNGNAGVVASRERGQGTPRRERQRESSALQDPGLKDYVRITSACMRGAWRTTVPKQLSCSKSWVRGTRLT